MILMVIKLSSWLFKPAAALTRCLLRWGLAALQGLFAPWHNWWQTPSTEHRSRQAPSGRAIPPPPRVAEHRPRALCLEDSLDNERCSITALGWPCLYVSLGEPLRSLVPAHRLGSSFAGEERAAPAPSKLHTACLCSRHCSSPWSNRTGSAKIYAKL